MKKERFFEILTIFRNYFRNHFLFVPNFTPVQKYCIFFVWTQNQPEFRELENEFCFGKIRNIMEKIANEEFKKNGMEEIKLWSEEDEE